MERILTESDEELVLKSQRGNRPAFEELVRRLARLVFSRIYLETRDLHRAEDLTQETFLTAWKSIRQVTDARGFRTWLLSVAHTTVIDAARRDLRKKRLGKHVGTEQLNARSAPEPDPAAAAELADERDNALAALSAMPQEYRDALMLRYIGGADYETIGRQLGVSNGSLRGLLGRGMQLLRSRLVKNREETQQPEPMRTP